MCFVEFNWTVGAYQFRIGQTFTDFQGVRSLPSLADWRAFLASRGCHLVKTDTRTWRVECGERDQ